jgi:glycosyltransferase involved in cell wall biosynthesis
VPDPTHTVIVPAYNAAETIEQAVRSVRAQTDSSFELVAVDDGSTDATPDLLRRMAAEDERIRVIRQKNAGPSAAREAAMGRASGRYLTFLDSDDLLMPSYLETMGATLGADAEIGLAHARAWVLDDAAGGGRVRQAIWPPPRYVTGSGDDPADPVVALASGNYVGGVQTARRSAVERAGGLDVGLDQAEDYDLWVRIAIAGFRIVSAPGTLVVLRNRAGSLSKDELELARGVRAVCERILSVYDVSNEARTAAKRQLDRADREIDVLSGRDPVRGALRRIRLVLGRAKRRLLSGRVWYPVPPPEVAEAFPELVRRRAPSARP